MISYLLESSLCLAAFYLLYRISLSKEKLLNLNRLYLAASAVIALIIPLLEIPIGSEVSLIPLSRDGGTTTRGIATSMTSNPAGYTINPWLAIYLFGLLISFTSLVKSSLHIRQLLQSPKEKVGKFWHVYTNQTEVSSFYRFIFLPAGFDENSDDGQLALAHEEVHLQHRHSLDLLFFQLLSVFFWFNPFAYAYKSAIKLQHEYIADDLVAQRTSRSTYSNSLIKHVLKSVNASLIHSYAEHPVEKRLEMIENPNPTKMKKLKPFAIAIPMLAILLFTFSCVKTKYVQLDNQGQAEEISAEQYEEIVKQRPTDQPTAVDLNVQLDGSSQTAMKLPGSIKGKVQAGKTGDPLQGVSVIRMPGRTSGTMTLEDGTYLVEVDESDKYLLFRKKGYKDMTIFRNKFSVINVSLTESPADEKGSN